MSAALLWAAQRSKHLRVFAYDACRTARGDDATKIAAATHALVQVCTRATAVREILIYAKRHLCILCNATLKRNDHQGDGKCSDSAACSLSIAITHNQVPPAKGV